MVNALKTELDGKIVLVNKDYLVPEYHDDHKRVFLCEGGFGCSPHTMGKAIFGTYLYDGEKCRIEGYMVEKIVEVCPTCNGKGDTGPAYDPDSCSFCRGTGYVDVLDT